MLSILGKAHEFQQKICPCWELDSVDTQGSPKGRDNTYVGTVHSHSCISVKWGGSAIGKGCASVVISCYWNVEACSSCWVDSCWSRFRKTPRFFLIPIRYREREFQILVSALHYFNIIYQNENGVSLKTKCAMCQTNQCNIVFLFWNSHVNYLTYYNYRVICVHVKYKGETGTTSCFAVLQVWNKKFTIDSQITFFSDSMSGNQLEHISKNNTTFLPLWIFRIYDIHKLL